MSDWNENVETCSDCGIEWKKIGKQCPVCFAPAEQKTKQMKTDQSELILKILDERDLSIGEIHSHGKEVTTDDLIDLNKKATNKVESLLSKQKMQIEVKTGLKVFKIYQEEMSKQRAELVEKVREIGDTSDYPEWEGSAGINVGLIPKERVIALIKDTDEVAEEKNK